MVSDIHHEQYINYYTAVNTYLQINHYVREGQDNNMNEWLWRRRQNDACQEKNRKPSMCPYPSERAHYT